MSLRSLGLRAGSVTSMALLLVACSASSGSSASASASAQPSSAPPSAAAADATVIVADSDLGQILTDADGNTIYYFANDTSGVSNCEGDCLSNWPPVSVSGDPSAGAGVSAELGTVDGNDGSTQLTVNGFPAYHFAGDQAPGDTNGQGVGGIWWVFGADGNPIES
jgi:predicted lipoprotein with Yx(FWY)xxD motif